MHRKIQIEKEYWDSLYLEVLHEAVDPTKNADVAALLMQEGLANLCLIKSTMTKVCAKIERTMPKKNERNNQYEKASIKFFDDVYKALQKNVNFEVVKVVLVGSPGFWAEEFLKYVFERAGRETDNTFGMAVLKNRGKFVKAHT